MHVWTGLGGTDLETVAWMAVRVKSHGALTNFTSNVVNVVNAQSIARAFPPVTGSGAAPGGGCVWPTLWRIGTTCAGTLARLAASAGHRWKH